MSFMRNWLLTAPIWLSGLAAQAQEAPTPAAPATETPAAVQPAPAPVQEPPPLALIPTPPVVVVAPASPPPVVKPPPAPPPYSVPWGLRGIVPVTVVRLDTAIGFFDRVNTVASNPKGLDTTGQTAVLMPSAGYKFTPNLMGTWRWGFIANSPPEVSGLSNAISVSNMAIGVMYGIKLPAGFRIGLALTATIPIGTGGYGDVKTGAGDPNTTEATKAAVLAREGMDNVMFAVNDFSVVPGLDFAYVGHRLTVQVEITFMELMRVKNENYQADQLRTNSTYALHLGYYVTKWLSLATELRYQRFLSNPAAVVAGTQSRDNFSLALGPRFHIKTSHGWFRPSIAYAPGLAGDLANNKYHILIVDFPFMF